MEQIPLGVEGGVEWEELLSHLFSSLLSRCPRGWAGEPAGKEAENLEAEDVTKGMLNRDSEGSGPWGWTNG